MSTSTIINVSEETRVSNLSNAEIRFAPSFRERLLNSSRASNIKLYEKIDCLNRQVQVLHQENEILRSEKSCLEAEHSAQVMRMNALTQRYEELNVSSESMLKHFTKDTNSQRSNFITEIDTLKETAARAVALAEVNKSLYNEAQVELAKVQLAATEAEKKVADYFNEKRVLLEKATKAMESAVENKRLYDAALNDLHLEKKKGHTCLRHLNWYKKKYQETKKQLDHKNAARCTDNSRTDLKFTKLQWKLEVALPVQLNSILDRCKLAEEYMRDAIAKQ